MGEREGERDNKEVGRMRQEAAAALRVAHSWIYGTLRLKTKLKFNK